MGSETNVSVIQGHKSGKNMVVEGDSDRKRLTSRDITTGKGELLIMEEQKGYI